MFCPGWGPVTKLVSGCDSGKRPILPNQVSPSGRHNRASGERGQNVSTGSESVIQRSSCPLVLASPAPHRVALIVSEHYCVIPLLHFSGKDDVRSVLLDLRPGD